MEYQFERNPHSAEAVRTQAFSAVCKASESFRSTGNGFCHQLYSREQKKQKHRIRARIMSILNLILGLILLIAGIVEPRNLMLIMVGAVGLLSAYNGFWHSRKKPAYCDTADALLDENAAVDFDRYAVLFLDSAMEVADKVQKSRTQYPYREFECLLETESLYLISFSKQGLFLWKSDLLEGEPEEFSQFIRQKVPCLDKL